MADGINYTGDLLRYVFDRLFDNVTDKSHWNVDDRNNVNMLRIITRETKSKFQLTIGVFSEMVKMYDVPSNWEHQTGYTCQIGDIKKNWIDATELVDVCN